MSCTTACKHCGFTVSFEEEDRGFEVYCDSCGRANLIPPALEPDQRPARDAAPAAVWEATETDRRDAEAAEASERSEQAPGDAEPAEAICETAEPDRLAAEPAQAIQQPSEAPGVPELESAQSTVSIFSASGAVEAEQQIVGEETCLCGTKTAVRVGDYGRSVYCPSCAAEIQVGSTLGHGKYRVAQEDRKEDATAKSAPVGKPRLRLIRSPIGIAVILLVIVSGAVGAYFTWQRPREVFQIVRRLLPRTDLSTQALPDDLPPQASEPTEASKVGPDPPLPLGTERSPAQVAEFQRLLQAIVDALKAENPQAARKALHEAEDSLRQHQDKLAPYCQRFLLLKWRVQTQEVAGTGANRIRKLLARADQDRADGRVTEALQAEAEAKFLALSTPLSDEEFQELSRKARELMGRIRFARGKRAVEDALGCERERDVEARNIEVRRVHSLLAGLPESQIRPLLERVRRWKEEAEKTPGRSHPTKSQISRDIQLRDHYEAVFEHYGNADCAQLVDACVKLQELLLDDEQSELKRQKIERILLDALERKIIGILQKLYSATEETTHVQQLSEIREILDRAKPWQTYHRWTVLDAAIRQQENRSALHTQGRPPRATGDNTSDRSDGVQPTAIVKSYGLYEGNTAS